MPGPGQRTKWWILEGGSHPHKAEGREGGWHAHSIISRSMLGEHARVMQGWVQEEWMEIRLVRRQELQQMRPSYPFSMLYSTWLIVVGGFRRWAGHSVCVGFLPPRHPNPPWRFVFPLSRTFHFYHSSCMSHIQSSISNPIGYHFLPL